MNGGCAVRKIRGSFQRKRLLAFLIRVLLLGGIIPGGRIAHAGMPADEGGGQFRGEFRKEITDPCLGQHWRLVIDPGRPGWPGRLILVNQKAQSDKQGGNRAQTGSDHAVLAGSGPDMQSMTIRAGDRVTVDQDSGLLNARFEAVALESARVGERLRVRLTMAGDGRQRLNPNRTAPGPIILVTATGSDLAQWTVAGEGPLIEPKAKQATDRKLQ
jgi:hypothetical protein